VGRICHSITHCKELHSPLCARETSALLILHPRKLTVASEKYPISGFSTHSGPSFVLAVVFFDAQLHTVDVDNRLSLECARSISIRVRNLDGRGATGRPVHFRLS
jgi:hypothetical protein